MHGPRRLTDTELADIRRRRPPARASLACEGLALTAEEEALFDWFDQHRLPSEERRERLLAFVRAQQHRTLPAAE